MTRIGSIIVLVVLSALPVSGVVCGVRCAAGSGGSGMDARHAAACHESPAVRPGAGIHGTLPQAGHDCQDHPGALADALAVTPGSRADDAPAAPSSGAAVSASTFGLMARIQPAAPSPPRLAAFRPSAPRPLRI